MAVSLRVIYWIPVVIFFIMNMLLKLFIFLLQHIGNATVWCNRQIIKAGDYCTDKAKNDDGLDNFLKNLQQKTAETKQRVDAKRLKK